MLKLYEEQNKILIKWKKAKKKKKAGSEEVKEDPIKAARRG